MPASTHAGRRQQPEQADVARDAHRDATGKSAKELGIPMPNPTIKPLIVRARHVDHVLAACSSSHKDKMPLAIAMIIGWRAHHDRSRSTPGS